MSIKQVSLWLLFLVPTVSTSDPLDRNGYYQGKQEGWFWRAPLPTEALAVDDVLLPTPVPATVPEAMEVTHVSMEPVVPAPFSAQWMREKLPVLRDRALQDPTPQNVRAYFYLQRHAMNMAERFALTAQSIVLTDPLLDENSRRPISTYGGQVFDAVARENTVRIATKIASDAGVWYFYRSDCEFCRAQNPVLDRLRRRIGLAILPIALDGRAMPEEPFARYVPNRGHAQQLGVNRTPTLFLVREPDQFIRLSEGFVTDDGLLERLIHVAYQAGWISEAEFQSTRAATPPPQNILTQAVDPSAHEDSVTLVDVLRAQESNAEAGLVP